MVTLATLTVNIAIAHDPHMLHTWYKIAVVPTKSAGRWYKRNGSHRWIHRRGAWNAAGRHSIQRRVAHQVVAHHVHRHQMVPRCLSRICHSRRTGHHRHRHHCLHAVGHWRHWRARFVAHLVPEHAHSHKAHRRHKSNGACRHTMPSFGRRHCFVEVDACQRRARPQRAARLARLTIVARQTACSLQRNPTRGRPALVIIDETRLLRIDRLGQLSTENVRFGLPQRMAAHEDFWLVGHYRFTQDGSLFSSVCRHSPWGPPQHAIVDTKASDLVVAAADYRQGGRAQKHCFFLPCRLAPQGPPPRAVDDATGAPWPLLRAGSTRVDDQLESPLARPKATRIQLHPSLQLLVYNPC